MKLISEFKENEGFEKALRSRYSEEVCDIVIEWTDEALRYVFKETEEQGVFQLGRVNYDTREVEYCGESYTCTQVITRVMSEMEHALDDEENESRETIESELEILSVASCK